MKKAILDTRFFFALHDPSSQAQLKWCTSIVLESNRSSSSVYAASCISITELYENMGRVVGRDAVRLRIASARNSGIEFIPVDEEISEIAGGLKLNSGEIPMSDAIIASTARVFSGGRLFTDDEHFKSIKNIRTSWVQ